jgi:hypothetical protein
MASIGCMLLFDGQVRLMLGMLQQVPYCYYPLTLQWLSEEAASLANGEGERRKAI